MKKITILFLLVGLLGYSQVIISDQAHKNYKSTNNSAILELDANLGFALPVMSEAERDQIKVTEDSKGLLIFSTTTKSLNLFDGSKWYVVRPQNEPIETSTICPNETTYTGLLDCIQSNYKPDQTLGYGPARDILYGTVDKDANNQLEGIYSGYKIDIDYSTSSDPSSEAFNKGINAEHVFPQSKGAKEEPARSDMYNLYPSKIDVNASRGSCPFNEIDDTQTELWYINDTSLTSIPTTNIDEYSESDNSSSCKFEPREKVKGNIARSVFYFYTIYNKRNTSNYKLYADDAFFKLMLKDLLAWDLQDPVDANELERVSKIKTYQGNVNPFVVDPSLGQRLFKLYNQ